MKNFSQIILDEILTIFNRTQMGGTKVTRRLTQTTLIFTKVIYV